MDIDDTTNTDVGSHQSPSPSPPLSPSNSTAPYCPNTSQDESNELDRMVVDMNIVEVPDKAPKTTEQALNAGVTSVDNNFAIFEPFISTFHNTRNEIISLYNKAEHHKELCGFLLKRCNFATAAVQDLDIRRTENAAFLSKKENLELFKEFVDCMKRIRTFIAEVSQLKRLKKYLHANNIEEKFTRLI